MSDRYLKVEGIVPNMVILDTWRKSKTHFYMDRLCCTQCGRTKMITQGKEKESDYYCNCCIENKVILNNRCLKYISDDSYLWSCVKCGEVFIANLEDVMDSKNDCPKCGNTIVISPDIYFKNSRDYRLYGSVIVISKGKDIGIFKCYDIIANKYIQLNKKELSKGEFPCYRKDYKGLKSFETYTLFINNGIFNHEVTFRDFFQCFAGFNLKINVKEVDKGVGRGDLKTFRTKYGSFDGKSLLW